jgi:hypothetical protein
MGQRYEITYGEAIKEKGGDECPYEEDKTGKKGINHLEGTEGGNRSFLRLLKMDNFSAFSVVRF